MKLMAALSKKYLENSTWTVQSAGGILALVWADPRQKYKTHDHGRSSLPLLATYLRHHICRTVEDGRDIMYLVDPVAKPFDNVDDVLRLQKDKQKLSGDILEHHRSGSRSCLCE